MKATEVRTLNEAELAEQLDELHDEWRTLRFQEAVGQLSATSRTREIRKTIARFHTIRTERQTEAETRAFLASGQPSARKQFVAGRVPREDNHA